MDTPKYCETCQRWLHPLRWEEHLIGTSHSRKKGKWKIQCPSIDMPMEMLGKIAITAGSKCMAHAATASMSALNAVLREGNGILNGHAVCTWCHLWAKSCDLLCCPTCRRKLKFIDSAWLKLSWRIQYRLLLDMFKGDTLILTSTHGSPVKASSYIADSA